MLVAGSHAQVFMAKQLRDGVNVRALHPEPTCSRVPEVVEAEVLDAHLEAQAPESHADLLRVVIGEQARS